MATTPRWTREEDNLFEGSEIKVMPNGNSMFRTDTMKAIPAKGSDYPHVTADVAKNQAHYSTDSGAKGTHSQSWQFDQTDPPEAEPTGNSENTSFNLFDPSTWI